MLSGDDGTCLDAMKSGADGVISVAANVVPDLLHALCAAAALQDWSVADGIDRRLRPLFAALALESNPIPVKWALFELQRIGQTLRLPMTPLAADLRDSVRHCLETLGLIPLKETD